MERTVHTRRRRARGDQGSALVEFTLVSMLLFLVLLAIIVFAYLMSFRGSMRQSAAEGARAAATAPNTLAMARAEAATAQAVGGFDKTCNADGLTCSFVVTPCTAAVGSPQCMTVTLTYDYDTNPLLPDIPLLDGVLPDTLVAKSVVELNPA